MYGAILGDIIGSPFEFDQGEKIKTFELFTPGCAFTDDSVMTIAVAEALMNVGRKAPDEAVKNALVGSMIQWGRRYPYAGYGARFIGWLRDDEPKPYNSCGNGSAMRVSAVGFMFDTLTETRRFARLTAAVSHNHPEGLKGAEATAAVMFLARNGYSKGEIKAYVEKEFQYDLSRTLDDIRPNYHYAETCQETVPQAITAFLEGTDFEDVIRNAVSLGGDTDTLGAIAGAMGEAAYGVPENLKAECLKRIDPEMRDVLKAYDLYVRRTK